MNIATCVCRLAPVVLVFAAFASAQEQETSSLGGLPRHGVVGLAVAPADSAKPEDPATNPVTVTAVTAGGAGEAAGIVRGDVVKEVDTEPVTSSSQFAYLIRKHLAGDSVRIVLLRGGEKIEKTVVLGSRPLETSADAEVIYGAVEAGGWHRRTILTRPKGAGRYPAVLLVGGLGCYSLDGALNDKTGYGPILTGLAKRGFVTTRVEKSGEGDSEGPACTDLKSTTELEARGYAAALNMLRTLDFVDADRIFVFAHSLGPLIASLALPQQKVRGVIAAETIGRSWYEYTLDNVRRQGALVGESPETVDASVREHARCGYHLFFQHETADEVEKLGETCRAMIRSYAGMPYRYMQQVADISLAKQWKEIDAPVLVIYGTSDPATSAAEGRYLVEIINRLHPGRASYAEIAGMGHDFGRYTSQTEFMNRRTDSKEHPFDEDALTIILSWLGERTRN